MKQLDEAKNALAKLTQLRAEQQAALEAAQAAIASLDAETGQRLLDVSLADGDVAAERATIAARGDELRRDIASAEAVLGALEKRIAAAQQALVVAKAAALEAKADELEKELAARLAKMRELIDALEAHEGKRSVVLVRSETHELQQHIERMRSGAAMMRLVGHAPIDPRTGCSFDADL